VITTVGDLAPNEQVEDAEAVYVEFSDGGRVQARIVGWDLFSDVGVIRVDPADHEVAPVPLGDSGAVRVGEPVAAIGSPFAQTSSLSVGVVSATGRSIASLTSQYVVADAIQIDAPINRGNSGGPLFDANGEVIGINAQIRSDSGFAEGVGFAIPINTALRSLEQLEKTGRVRYAWLGVRQVSMTPTMAHELGYDVERGALIECVVDGSPAAEAGLRGGDRRVMVAGQEVGVGGDVVVAIEGEPVETSADLSRIVSTVLFPGNPAAFAVIRDGERVDLVQTPGDRSESTTLCTP
jgi:S1-C subfamily serine protease